MEVHKPKHPIHGFREFLKEVGIIVLGVLLALAAEQSVEALRERHAAADARESINAEIAANLGALSNRVRTQPCIEHRLTEVAALMGAGQRSGYTPPLWIGRPQIWPMEEGSWHSEANAGRAALLPSAEQAHYSALYNHLERLTEWQLKEQDAWARLRVLSALSRLTPDMAFQLDEELNEAQLDNFMIKLEGDRSRRLARALRIPKVEPALPGSPSVCIPINTPRADALGRVAAESGDNLGEP